MNVNVTVELEFILWHHHVTTGCFYLVHIFASTKYLSVIYRGRGLGSVNPVVSKESITDHSNQLLMLWLSQLSSVKVGE